MTDDYADYPVAFYYPTETNRAFTGRAGLVYLATNGLAPFISFSQSFEPTVGYGIPLEPTKGQQYEAGVRYRPNGLDPQFSAAVYQLTQTNLVQATASGIPVQIGEARSRGVELEVQGRVGRNTNVTAAYAYTDARVTRGGELTPQEVGSRLSGVPYNQLSAWADHTLAELGWPQLKIGGGVRHVGATRGLPPAITGEVPAFTLVDLMASYTTGPWKFAVNVTNLVDKTYIASCTYGCFYGEPRKVIGTATYRW